MKLNLRLKSCLLFKTSVILGPNWILAKDILIPKPKRCSHLHFECLTWSIRKKGAGGRTRRGRRAGGRGGGGRARGGSRGGRLWGWERGRESRRWWLYISLSEHLAERKCWPKYCRVRLKRCVFQRDIRRVSFEHLCCVLVLCTDNSSFLKIDKTSVLQSPSAISYFSSGKTIPSIHIAVYCEGKCSLLQAIFLRLIEIAKIFKSG